MRASIRMTGVVCLAGAALYGGSGVIQLRAERADLRASVDREMRLLGRSLKAGIDNAVRDQQFDDVRDVLSRLERIDPHLDVYVYDRTGTLVGSSEGASPLAAPAAMPDGEVVDFEPEGSFGRAVFQAPLESESGQQLGAVVVYRPLDDARADLVRTRDRLVVTLAVFLVCTSLLTFALVELQVRRPVDQLILAMRRVRIGGNLAELAPAAWPAREFRALRTEFNAMQAQLHEAESKLFDETEERRHLTRALEQADRLVTIGQLSAELAHEIGSPLQVLHGRARALLAHADDPERTRRYAGILAEECTRITRIVEQLLSVTRRQPMKRGAVDLPRTTRAVLELLDSEAHRLRVALEFECEQQVSPIRGNGDQIQQIVLNLTRNALAATPAGGRVLVQIDRDTLTRDGQGAQEALRLAVCDTGRGMDDATRARLFEPFFTSRADEGGTGLGLSIVHGIVTAHGGSIDVESAPGRGSRFIVRLPLDQGGECAA